MAEEADLHDRQVGEFGEPVRCPEARAVRAEVDDDAFDRRAAGEGEKCR